MMGASHPVKSMTRRCFVVLLELTYAAIVTGQTCYTPYGSALIDWGICESQNTSSLCCAIGDTCLSNRLCQATDKNFYRGGCTDISYASKACPSFCNSSNSLYYPPGVVRTGGAAYLVTECGDFLDKYYCCDDDGSRSCCNNGAKSLSLPIADDSFVASSPTQLVSSTPAASSQTSRPPGPGSSRPLPVGPQSSRPLTTTTVNPGPPAQSSHLLPTTTVNPGYPGPNASNHSNHHAVVIGAATGSSIAALFIVLGIFAGIWLHRHPPRQENSEDQEEGVERAAVDEPNRSARVMDWADGSLLDSSRDLPSTISTQSPVHHPIEVNSPNIRRLTSFTHQPPSPITTTNAESHRRMPSADQVSAISIGSPYIPYQFPPRTAASPIAANQMSPTNIGSQYYTSYNPPPELAGSATTAELESRFDIAPIQVPSRSTSRPPPPAPLELEARDGVTITAIWRANTSPDSPRGPPRRESPMHTMLQASPTLPEYIEPKAASPDSPRGSHRRRSPLQTMLQSSPTLPEHTEPSAGASIEHAGSAENTRIENAPVSGPSLGTVVQNAHPTNERTTRHVLTPGALSEGESSGMGGGSHDSQGVQEGGLASQGMNMAGALLAGGSSGAGGGSRDSQGVVDEGHASQGTNMPSRFSDSSGSEANTRHG